MPPSRMGRNERIRELYEAAYSFEEGRRVPFSVGAGLAILNFAPNLS